MTLRELQQSEWYLSKPLIIQEVFDVLPPFETFRITQTGAQCFLYSISEPESGDLDDVVVSVIQTGIGGFFWSIGLGHYEKGTIIHGILIDELEKWRD